MSYQQIWFKSGDLKCVGWFFKASEKQTAPCVILGHGFCGVKEARLDAFARQFADAGYHALVFDYRHFGGSPGSPRQLLSIKKQQQDWHAAISYARRLPEVDTNRIILWGTSFSGGHVVEVAVRDGGIAAVISQVPHMNGFATALTAGPVQSIRLFLAGVYDLIRGLAGYSPFYVPAFGKPRQLAAMTAPGAFEASRMLFPADLRIDESVAARIFLAVPFFNPCRLAPHMYAPWLVQVAEKDQTTPPAAAIKAAQKAPRAELITYQLDHFDLYTGPDFKNVIHDQLKFLNRHLG